MNEKIATNSPKSPGTRSMLVGIALLLAFNVIAGGGEVYVGNLVQSLDPVLALIWVFGLAAAFFLALACARPLRFARFVRDNFRTLLLLNLGSSAAWFGYYLSLKYVEPAISSAVGFAMCPIGAILIQRYIRRPRKPVLGAELASAVGIGISIAAMAWLAGTGRSAVGALSLEAAALGVGFAILAGIGCSGVIEVSKRLGDPIAIMASRFVLQLGLAYVILRWAHIPLELPLALGIGWKLGLLAIATAILPLYLFQIGLGRVEPLTASLIVAAVPAFTLALEWLDPRLAPSWPSAAAVLACIAACAYGVWARVRAISRDSVELIFEDDPVASEPALNPVALRPACLIVDGYRAGAQLAPLFRALGYACYHVQSGEDLPRSFTDTLRAEDYDARFIFKKEAELLAQLPRDVRWLCAVAGTETGVLVADRLSVALGLPANRPELSLARRDKFEMGEAVRRAGLRAIRQCRASSPEEILTWARAHGLAELVLKPLSSAGTDGVRFCRATLEEVSDGVDAILGKRNALGLVNDAVLAQERLRGIEYVVNTVSAHGVHFVTTLWRYRKREIAGAATIYDADTLLPSRGRVSDALTSYAFDVLDALGFLHGPAHAEVMITREGPVLIEVGARLDGVSNPPYENHCVAQSQAELTVDCFARTERFIRHVQLPYRILRHPIFVSLSASQEGWVTAVPGAEIIRGLKSFYSIELKAQPGKILQRTRDLFTAAGFVALAHEDPEQVARDLARIRELEVSGSLFRISLRPPRAKLASASSSTSRKKKKLISV